MKLAYWNGLNGAELVHVLGPEITWSLWNRPQGSVWRKLGHCLKDSERTLQLAFPPFVLSRTNARVDRLRGCPRCYLLGFHSPLFQLSILERCPIHGDPLVEGCPRCAYPEPYAVTDRWPRDGYRCPVCRRAILKLGSEEQLSGVLPLLPRLSNWRHWIMDRLSTPADATGDEGAAPSKSASDWLEVLKEWGSRYAEIPQLPVAPSPVAKGAFSPSQMEEASSEASLYELAGRGYYQARRLRRRTFSTKDRILLRALLSSRQTWWPYPLCRNSGAYAFALWRAAWERSSAFGRPATSLSHWIPPLTVVQWLASRPLAGDEPESVVLQRFDRELSRSYSRCERLVAWMRTQGGILMSPEVLRLLIPRLCIRLPR